MVQPARRTSSITDIHFTLRKVFNKPAFRDCQEDIVTAAISGHDILVLLPTGYGKSLTYQLPAVAVDHGCTIVISPLVVLMRNQVHALQAQNINAVALNTLTSTEERRRILNDLARGHPQTRLLYVSPELCATSSFRAAIDRLVQSSELNRIVVDEAHCCVEWGQSFRKEYAKLGYFKKRYPWLPITAVTATAPERLKDDISTTLNLPPEPQLKVFTSSVNRPNLHYEVRYIDTHTGVVDDIAEFLKKYAKRRQEHASISSGSGIIYCRRRYMTETIAKELQARGIGAMPFHANLSPAEKTSIMDKWIDNDPAHQIIVATIAFGMGVDKPDVRFVIHYDLPSNLLAYQQASGRAGRDGKAARCILYYSRADGVRLQRLQPKPKRGDEEAVDEIKDPAGFAKLIEFCESSSQCRHLLLAQYFDASTPSKPDSSWCSYACDYCKDKDDVKKRILALDWSDDGFD